MTHPLTERLPLATPPEAPRWRRMIAVLAGPVVRLHRYRALRNAAVQQLVAGRRHPGRANDGRAD